MNFEDTYFYNRQVSISRVPIGTVGIRINPELFKNELEDSSPDTVITTKVRLSDGFGQRLFNSINPEDTLFTTPSYFSDKFKGLAILATQSDKIFGIDNFSENTVLTIYYHEGNTQKTIGFSLSNRVAFTQITGDRSGTDLTGLNTFYSEFNHPINRYIQNGTSIITKLDFSEFYKYMDTIPNITINSAELSITNVDPTDQFAPPGSLSLAMIKRNNRYKTITGSQDTLDFIAFRGSLIISDLNKLYAANDAGGLFTIPYSNTDHSYVGHPTLFAQRLFNLKQTEYPYWALVPVSPPIGKAVNRVVFPKDNIKLKIYYTRPILTENP